MHMERIVRTDMLATAYLRDACLKDEERIVDLECGHKAITAAFKRCVCLRCREMFKRSVGDGSEDWDAFRHIGKCDEMAWKDDPVRQLNEPTDLEGRFMRTDDYKW